jgi:type III secretion protein T
MVDVARQWQLVLMVVALLMSRMLVAFSVIPLFVGNTVPAFIRTIFVAGLAMSLLPLALSDSALTTIPLASMMIYIAKEAVIGLVLGLLASAGFWALYIAGTIIEYQAGLTFATTIDPLTGQDDSLVGGLLMRLFTVLFLVTGGLLSLIGMLFESYQLWPLSKMAPVAGNLQLLELVLRAFAEMVILALKVAAPFLILMLLIELALGFLSRFAPQLNVFFVALPLKVLVLAVMLLLYGMVIASSGQLLSIGDLSHVLDPLRGVLR